MTFILSYIPFITVANKTDWYSHMNLSFPVVFKGEFRPMDYEGFDMDDIQRIKELPSDGDEDDPLNAKLRKKKKKKKKKNKKKQMKKRLKKLQVSELGATSKGCDCIYLNYLNCDICINRVTAVHFA